MHDIPEVLHWALEEDEGSKLRNDSSVLFTPPNAITYAQKGRAIFARFEDITSLMTVDCMMFKIWHVFYLPMLLS